MAAVWEVVGGADKGGILVRLGHEFTSQPATQRLSTGARVQQIELVEERLHYRLFTGSGPSEGWVSLRVGAKDLLRQVDVPKQQASAGGGYPNANVARRLREKAEQFCRENSRKSCADLPPEAVDWDDRECDLWFRTDGLFHPQRPLDDAGGYARPPEATSPEASKGRVSVIVPTTEERQALHEVIWLCFETQDWANKELVVVETYTNAPSPFFADKRKEDSRIVYVAFQRTPGADFSVGLKRNIGVHLGTGQYVAHFDDDDLYAPSYLSAMAGYLDQSRQAHAVKLSTWYSCFWEGANQGTFGRCDPNRVGNRRNGKGKGKGKEKTKSKDKGEEDRDTWIRRHAYGFGFSYVYRRGVALSTPFRDMNSGEDYDFLSRLLKRGEDKVLLLEDGQGICLHVQHGKNLLDCTPCRAGMLATEEVNGLEFALSPAFEACIDISGLIAHYAYFEQNPEIGTKLIAAMVNGLSTEQLFALTTGLNDDQRDGLAAGLSGKEPLDPELATSVACGLTEPHLRSIAASLNEEQRGTLLAGILGQQPLPPEVSALLASLGDERLEAFVEALNGEVEATVMPDIDLAAEDVGRAKRTDYTRRREKGVITVLDGDGRPPGSRTGGGGGGGRYSSLFADEDDGSDGEVEVQAKPWRRDAQRTAAAPTGWRPSVRSAPAQGGEWKHGSLFADIMSDDEDARQDAEKPAAAGLADGSTGDGEDVGEKEGDGEDAGEEDPSSQGDGKPSPTGVRRTAHESGFSSDLD